MTVTGTNAVMGPMTVYYGAFGAAEPADASVNTTPAASAWTDLGGTTGGVTINANQTFATMTFDQTLDIVGTRATQRDVQIVVSLAEPTLDNLKIVLNGGTVATGSGYKSYDPDSSILSTQPTYGALLLDGWAPASVAGATKRRRMVCRKVLSIDNVGIPYRKDAQTVFPVTMRCHFVDSSTKPFRFIDET
ncbi:MAG TPA: hypothetical protein VHA75_20675 [Rugosimonospora sp.]|nr:hypothetical protein [Rugosimonospora sp.]